MDWIKKINPSEMDVVNTCKGRQKYVKFWMIG